MAIVCRVGAVTGSSSTVSPGSHAVGSCSGVISIGDSLARLSALVPSVRSLVAGLRYAVVSFGCAVTILSGPVPILGGVVRRRGTVPIVAAGTLIFVHGGWRDSSAIAFKPRPVAIHLSGDAVDAGVARFETGFPRVVTRRPVPSGPIMQPGLRVVIVGCLVVLSIEAPFLVGGHTAPFHSGRRTSCGTLPGNCSNKVYRSVREVDCPPRLLLLCQEIAGDGGVSASGWGSRRKCQLLGHARLETTRVYMRPTAEDRGKAVDLLPVDE